MDSNFIGIFSHYSQTLDLYVFVPKDVNKKLVKVNIGLDTLKVYVNGQAVIDGKLKGKINADDSLWTIEEGQIQDYKGKYINIAI